MFLIWDFSTQMTSGATIKQNTEEIGSNIQKCNKKHSLPVLQCKRASCKNKHSGQLPHGSIYTEPKF